GHAEPDPRRPGGREPQGHHRVEHAAVHRVHAGALGDQQALERPQGRVPGLLGLLGEGGEVSGGGPGARDRGAESELHDPHPTKEKIRPNGPWCEPWRSLTVSMRRLSCTLRREGILTARLVRIYGIGRSTERVGRMGTGGSVVAEQDTWSRI